MDPLINIQGVRIVYNQGKSNEVRALEETNIAIYPKEYVIIFGPSGCGKSTLLYSIAGLQRPTYGEITLAGKGYSKMTPKEMLELHQTGIGLVFQAFYLIPSLTILDNVCLPKTFRGVSTSMRHKDGVQLLRRFNIVEQSDKYPSQLSGGQKQRVAIARSLINNPLIILADEPVGNLDSESAENVLKILKELNEVDQKTIIMVTHNPEHLVYADRIIYMKDGRVVSEEVRKDKRPKDAEDKVTIDVPKETAELRQLMDSFKTLLPQQVDVLLVPFKAKQLLSHVLSDLNDEQIAMAETLIRELLFRNIQPFEMQERLDLDYDKGGGGWNKMRAIRTTKRVTDILTQVQNIKTNAETSVPALTKHLIELFHMKMNHAQELQLQALLSKRVGASIGQKELLKNLDLPASQGGIGLHRATAERVSREVEIIMLLKYS